MHIFYILNSTKLYKFKSFFTHSSNLHPMWSKYQILDETPFSRENDQWQGNLCQISKKTLCQWILVKTHQYQQFPSKRIVCSILAFDTNHHIVHHRVGKINSDTTIHRTFHVDKMSTIVQYLIWRIESSYR